MCGTATISGIVYLVLVLHSTRCNQQYTGRGDQQYTGVTLFCFGRRDFPQVFNLVLIAFPRDFCVSSTPELMEPVFVTRALMAFGDEHK